MNYTQEEILAATTRIVRDAIRRPYGTLGNREVGTTFSDIRDAAAGLFLLYPRAPFYIIDLSTDSLVDLVGQVTVIAGELQEYVENVARHVVPVDDLGPLNNASQALGALAGATSNRTSTFIDITEVPAFKRFDSNMQRFLDGSSSQLKKNGVIVPTPEQSRAEIPGKLTELIDGVGEVRRRVALIRGALDDFGSLQLRATLQQHIIGEARDVLNENIELLQNKTPKARLADLRDVTLDLLVARSIIRGFGSLSGPTTFALIDGSGGPHADETHPAEPAVLTSEIYGPYPILADSNELDFFLDGDSSITTTIALQGSYVASVDSAVPETYEIIGGTNDTFTITMTDHADYAVNLSAGAAQSARDIVADINGGITSEPIVAEPYRFPVKLTTSVTVTPGIPDTFTLPNESIDPVALNIEPGDLLYITEGPNAGKLYSIGGVTSPVGATPGFITATLVVGAATVVSTDDVIEVGGPQEYFRIRFNDASRLQALQENWQLGIAAVDAGSIEEATTQTIGLLGGIVSTSRPTPVRDLFDNRVGIVPGVASSPSAAVAGTTRVVASREFVPTLFSGQGRTVTTSSLLYVLFKLRARASTVTTLAGTTTIVVPDTTGAEVGDIVVLREAGATADVNASATLTSVTDTELVATFSSPPSDTTDVLVEVGPDIVVPNNAILVLTGNTANDGTYEVSWSGSTYPRAIPFELPLRRSVPTVAAGGGLPVVSTAELGLDRVLWASTDTTLATEVRVTDGDVGSGPNAATAYNRFFTSSPSPGVRAVGATPYFQLPEDPKTLEIGDELEFYESNYATVSIGPFEITGLELSQRLIELAVPLDTDLGTFEFSTEGIVPPFARIRKKSSDNFAVLDEALEVWEAKELSEVYFRNLRASINPLLSSSNPTVVQVNDVKLDLQVLQSDLGELIDALGAYEALHVPQVDALISSFVEKGAQRAVDILLECRFTDFFGLDVNGTSYAGDVLSKIKAIQRLDLPVRKVRRSDAFDETTLGTFNSPDYEFDFSDIEDNLSEPDLPAGSDKPFPGGAY